MKRLRFSEDNGDMFEVYKHDGWINFRGCFDLLDSSENKEPVWLREETHALSIEQLPKLIKYLQTIANSEGE